MIEEALAEQNTTLEEFLRRGLSADVSPEELTFDLRRRTRVPVSARTVRRWADALEPQEAVS